MHIAWPNDNQSRSNRDKSGDVTGMIKSGEIQAPDSIVAVNNGTISASYVEVDETTIEDYGQDILKLDAGKEAIVVC